MVPVQVGVCAQQLCSSPQVPPPWKGTEGSLCLVGPAPPPSQHSHLFALSSLDPGNESDSVTRSGGKGSCLWQRRMGDWTGEKGAASCLPGLPAQKGCGPRGSASPPRWCWLLRPALAVFVSQGLGHFGATGNTYTASAGVRHPSLSVPRGLSWTLL